MKSHDIIIFDLDGTLFDTLPDITASVEQTFQKLSLTVPGPDEIRNAVGWGARQLFLTLLNGKEKLTDTALNIFQGIYLDNIAVRTKPYPDVPETLEKLQAFHSLNILTNKPKKFTLPLLDKFCFSQLFDSIITPEDISDLKKPDERLCSLDILKNGRLFVGDSSIDMEMAHKSRVPSVFVTYGYGKPGLHTPDFAIDRFSDIIKILNY